MLMLPQLTLPLKSLTSLHTPTPCTLLPPKSRAGNYTIKYDLPCMYAKDFYICIMQGERNSDSEFNSSIVLVSTLELYIASLFNKTRRRLRNHFLHSIFHSTNEKATPSEDDKINQRSNVQLVSQGLESRLLFTMAYRCLIYMTF